MVRLKLKHLLFNTPFTVGIAYPVEVVVDSLSYPPMAYFAVETGRPPTALPLGPPLAEVRRDLSAVLPGSPFHVPAGPTELWPPAGPAGPRPDHPLLLPALAYYAAWSGP